MNYKLLILGLTLTAIGQNFFGMQKPTQLVDFNNQALKYITEYKTSLLLGSCAVFAGGLLYNYWFKPSISKSQRIKAKIKKDTRPWVQLLANQFINTGKLSDKIWKAKRGSYSIKISEFKNSKDEPIGVQALYTFACDTSQETVIVPGIRN